MTARIISAIALVTQLTLIPSTVMAGEGWDVLSPAQKRVYHACLYASFIQDYCRFHVWGSSEAECVIANRAGRIPPAPYWGFGVYHACRALVERTRW